MIKTLKLTTLLIAMVGILPTLAAYRIAIPLEATQGGSLPDNTISFGTKPNPDSGETPSNNCIYNDTNLVQILTAPLGQYQTGDIAYVYNNNVVGFNSPSNGLTTPNGLSIGQKQGVSSNPPAENFEFCFDNNWIPPIENPPIENPPIDNQTGPDWTPECILNTTTDYAAINTLNGSREFHSTTFGLNHFAAPNWYYVPAGYNPNNPSSYIYFDNSEQTGDPRVSGPNPNFTYAEICRVRKRDL